MWQLDAHAREVLDAENIPLHNELIRGIFQNAVLGTISPPAHEVLLEDPLDGDRPSKKAKVNRMMQVPGMPQMGGAQVKQSVPGEAPMVGAVPSVLNALVAREP